jgi:hypothetical protein
MMSGFNFYIDIEQNPTLTITDECFEVTSCGIFKDSETHILQFLIELRLWSPINGSAFIFFCQ